MFSTFHKPCLAHFFSLVACGVPASSIAALKIWRIVPGKGKSINWSTSRNADKIPYCSAVALVRYPLLSVLTVHTGAICRFWSYRVENYQSPWPGLVVSQLGAVVVPEIDQELVRRFYSSCFYFFYVDVYLLLQIWTTRALNQEAGISSPDNCRSWGGIGNPI